jgi:Na+/H+ antiporter NhaC
MIRETPEVPSGTSICTSGFTLSMIFFFPVFCQQAYSYRWNEMYKHICMLPSSSVALYWKGSTLKNCSSYYSKTSISSPFYVSHSTSFFLYMILCILSLGLVLVYISIDFGVSVKKKIRRLHADSHEVKRRLIDFICFQNCWDLNQSGQFFLL